MLMLDIFSSVILFLVYSSLTPDTTEGTLVSAQLSPAQDNGYLVAGLLLGTLTTVLGGYLVARIAKKMPFFNALAVGLMSLIAGIVLGGNGDEVPLWYQIMGYITVIPAALAGARLAQRKAQSFTDDMVTKKK